MKKLLIPLMIVSSLYAHKFTKSQNERLSYVKKVAGEYTKYKSTVAAIYAVECSAGACREKVGDDGHSVGVFQWQVKSARWLAGEVDDLNWINEKLTDEEIIYYLLTDLDFSIMLTSHHFNHYISCGWSYRDTVMIYNGMPEGKPNWTYFNKIEAAKVHTRALK